ncbi:MAG: transcription termination factor NusA [Patescibacteria group bacterium]|nr:transcription termination factor NusA [Patescibacteria group bacterium]
MSSPITQAIKQICEEKNIPVESVIETIEAALAVAYRKDFGEKNQNIKVEFNTETAQSRVFDVKTVVDITQEEIEEEERKREERRKAFQENKLAPITEKKEVEKEVGDKKETAEPAEDEAEAKKAYDPKTMIPLEEVKKNNPKAKVDDVIKTELFPPQAYGRMAAQTAKQVIIQRLREAERETVFKHYKDKEGQIINGTIQRVEGKLTFVDLGDTAAIMPPSERVESESYQPGLRLKFYLVNISQAPKGPEIIVSRSHPEMVKRLFEFEVPEIASGAVEIKSIAREAGSRTKIAVASLEPNIDPVGSCVGQRGTRVQTVISELGGEKIDIVEYEEDPVKFIINALAPAKVLSVQTKEAEKTALAEVKEDQLSLAIGRGGQNVRLAARLTGWKIDIIREGDTVPPKTEEKAEKDVDETKTEPVAEEPKNETVVEEKIEEKPAAEKVKEEKPTVKPKRKKKTEKEEPSPDKE